MLFILYALAILYACVFVSVLIDLFFGVKRAQRLIITCTSFGYPPHNHEITKLFWLKTVQYIPLESTKTEYRNNFVRNSIFRYDSIFVKQTADTIFFERYQYLYKDRIIRDSIFKCDTIRVPYPVEVVKEVKAPLSSWQNFQVWCGRIPLQFFYLLAFILC
ncbi:MAG: hypothetical protein LBT04_02505 [Prevotellaceae bacterium]|jgi:hypothetical protein|nr:hypothetical protein [Prevotellaceae bacterium]